MELLFPKIDFETEIMNYGWPQFGIACINVDSSDPVSEVNMDWKSHAYQFSNLVVLHEARSFGNTLNFQITRLWDHRWKYKTFCSASVSYLATYGGITDFQHKSLHYNTRFYPALYTPPVRHKAISDEDIKR